MMKRKNKGKNKFLYLFWLKNCRQVCLQFSFKYVQKIKKIKIVLNLKNRLISYLNKGLYGFRKWGQTPRGKIKFVKNYLWPKLKERFLEFQLVLRYFPFLTLHDPKYSYRFFAKRRREKPHLYHVFSYKFKRQRIRRISFATVILVVIATLISTFFLDLFQPGGLPIYAATFSTKWDSQSAFETNVADLNSIHTPSLTTDRLNVDTSSNPGEVNLLTPSRFNEDFLTTNYKDSATIANWDINTGQTELSGSGEWKYETGGIYQSVSFISATTGWAVTKEGLVFYTSDSGTTWTKQYSTTKYLYGISALDSTHIWAVGSNGKILFYNGTSWTSQTSGTSNYLNSVSALDSTHVWAVGDNGTILFYDGASWTSKSIGAFISLKAVQPISATDIFVVGDRGLIIETNDNGSTWKYHSGGSLRSVSIVPGLTGVAYAVGDFGLIIKTTDNGLNWYVQDSFSNRNLYGVSALDSTHVWAVGYYGAILFYDGVSWTFQTSGTTNTLYSVSALDSTHVWAVGDNGKILFYNGTSWTSQASGTTNHLRGVSALDTTHVWAVGGNGTILFYDGTSWTSQASGTTNHLRGVSALDTTHVWAVGGNGTILFYDGTSWTSQTSGTSNYLLGVSALDSTHIWAVGYYGTILFYDGSSWTSQTSGTSNYLYGIFALDSTHVWAVGGNGTILFYDSASWTSQTSGTSNFLLGVSALDSTHVWVVGRNGTILFYDGSSWTSQTSGTNGYLYGVFALDSTHVWAVGSGGTILFYDGSSWTSQTSGTTNTLNGVSALDSTHIWAVGSDGTILFYNGASWTPQTNGTSNYLYGISALDSTHIWAVGSNGKILFYNGASWTSQTSGTSKYLYGVSALDSTHVWAVGSSGTILFYDGSSWTSQTSGTSNYLYGISALDSTHVWAVGSSGTILFYDGSSWTSQTSGTSNYLLGASALDSTHVWVVGRNGTILFYDGSSWTPQTSGTSNYLYGVFALDSTHVWAVGSSGTILFYDGASWTSQTSGTTNTLHGVSIIDSTHIWAVGYYGTILFYDGASWTDQSIGLAVSFEGINGTDFSNIKIVGDDGLIFKYDFSYNSSDQALSIKVNTGTNNIFAAKLTANQNLNGQTINYYLSSDGGANWESVNLDVIHYFLNNGNDLRWKAVLSTNDSNVTPIINSLTIDYRLAGRINYFKIDAGGAPDSWGNITWSASIPSGSAIKCRTRSSANDSDYSDWSDYYTISGSSITSPLNRYLEVQLVLQVDSADNDLPNLNWFNIDYVINAPPEFNPNFGTNGVTAEENSNGTVFIQYSVRDSDTSSGSNTPGYITPSFKYNLGSGWLDITSDYLAVGDLDNKVVSENDYTTYTATWNAKAQVNNTYNNIQVRVIIDDNEQFNNTTISDSSNFVLDTKNPTNCSVVIDANASSTLTLSATDESALQMNISNIADNFPEENYVTSTSSYSWNLSGNPANVYVRFRDVYGNYTDVSAKTPNQPGNMYYQDISNISTGDYKEFLAWGVIPEPNSGFAEYRIYRSTDGQNFSLYQLITDRLKNYIVDNNVTSTQTYYYKVAAKDSLGNVSFFSEAISDQPNGLGGTDLTSPTISNVVLVESNTTWAKISWQTDKLSNSEVDFSNTTSTPYSNGKSVLSMVKEHTVILTNLTPDTHYYFQVKSTDVSGNSSTDNNNGAGYSFTTLPGPIISNVAISSTYNTKVTISWLTNEDSNSYVIYSPNSDLSNSQVVGNIDLVGGSGNSYEHSIIIHELNPKTKYYFAVKSIDKEGNEAIDNNSGSYYSFFTTYDQIPPVISDIIVTSINGSSTMISWKTDELSDSQIIYGLTTDYSLSSNIDTQLTISHTVELINLTEGQTYHFKVKSTDSQENLAVSDDQTFIPQGTSVCPSCGGGGGGGVDTNPPVISNLKISELFSDSAIISWQTNEKSYSLVQFGKNENNSNLFIGDPETLVLSHQIKLSNLEPETKYFYKVFSADRRGNLKKTTTNTFSTLKVGETPQKVLPSKTEETKTKETEKSILLSNAVNNLRNILQIVGNSVSTPILRTSLESIQSVLEGSTSLLIGPVLEAAPKITISSNQAIIEWTTDKQANGLVAFSPEDNYHPELEESYQQIVGDPYFYTKNHKVILVGLNPSTKYHFQIKSKEKVGPTTKSKDITFTTKSEMPQVIEHHIKDVSNNSATFVWKTNIETDSQVKYTPYYNGRLAVSKSRTEGKPEMTVLHNITLDNLISGTTYAISLQGKDMSGNLYSYSIPIFNTAKDNEPPKISQLKTDSTISPQGDRIQVIIAYLTNEPATSRIVYQVGFNKKSNVYLAYIDNTLVKKHTAVISTFKPDMIYRFKVESIDASGNKSESHYHVILTPRRQQSVVELMLDNLGQTFGWMRRFKIR